MRSSLLIVMAILFAIACKKTETAEEQKLTVSESSISLGSTPGAADTFLITSTRSWSITTSPAGILRATPSSGTGSQQVVVSVLEPNTTGSIRNVTLTINDGLSSQAIQVTQQPQALQPSPLTDSTFDILIGGSGTEILTYSVYSQDSGMLHIGVTNGNDPDFAVSKGGNDVLILRTDSDGKLVWKKVLQGSWNDFAFSCVRVGAEYYITGSTASNDGDFAGRFNEDMYLIKINDRGDVLFSKKFGGDGIDRGLKVIHAGNRIIVAGTSFVDSKRGDFWLSYHDLNGDQIFSKRFGNDGEDLLWDVAVAADNSVYVCGTLGRNTNSYQTDTIPPALGESDMLVTKLDANGDLVWSRRIGGSGADEGWGLAIVPNGGVIAVGYGASLDVPSLPNRGGKDSYAVRLDADGNELWRKSYGAGSDDQFAGITATANGRYLVFGSTRSSFPGITDLGGQDGWVMLLDASGNIEWQAKRGGAADDQIYTALPFSTVGVWTTGYSKSINMTNTVNKGNDDYWLSYFRK